MSGKIFISYRRNDSEGEAGRLYDDLMRVFHAEAVFMDVSDIHPGKDFRQAIDQNVAKCSVMLAIIGPAWVNNKDASGARRLEQPNDFVRLEIASALARDIDVIPVLVHGASMVAPSDLPDNIQNLAFRNGVEITHARWNSDVERLIRTLRDYVTDGQQVPTRSIQMAITGENPSVKPAAPVTNVQPATPIKTSGRWAVAAVLVMVVAGGVGAGSYAYIRHYLKSKKNVAAQTAAAPDATPSSTASSAEPKKVSARTSTAGGPRSSPGSGAVPQRAVAQTIPATGNAPSSAASAGPTAAPGANPVSTADHPTAAAPASHQPALEGLSGAWLNPVAKKGKPMRMEITAQPGNTASIHLWTRLHDAPNDVGTKSLAVSGADITLQWQGPFSNAGDKEISDQTVSMRIYRVADGLHMIFTDAKAGTAEFDFVRTQ